MTGVFTVTDGANLSTNNSLYIIDTSSGTKTLNLVESADSVTDIYVKAIGPNICTVNAPVSQTIKGGGSTSFADSSRRFVKVAASSDWGLLLTAPGNTEGL
jgi:hypothetical protein